MKHLKQLLTLVLLAIFGFGQMWGETATITFKVKGSGSSSTSYVTSETEQTTDASNSSLKYKMNNWNPSNGQVRGGSNGNKFYIYNADPIPGSIRGIEINGGSYDISKVYYTTGTTARSSSISSGAMSSTNQSVTGSNTYFRIQFASGATSGNQYMTSVIVTYEVSGSNKPTVSVDPVSANYSVGDNATNLSVTATASAGSLSYQWYSNTANSTTTPTPTALSNCTTATYKPSTASAGTTYYFCKVTDSNGSTNSGIATIKVSEPTGTFSLYSGALTEGDYVITYSNKAMNTTFDNSYRLGYTEVTPSNNKLSNPASELVWHIAPSGNYWTIYSNDEEKYLAGTGAKTALALVASGDGDTHDNMWTASGTYDFTNVRNTAASVNATLRENTTFGFGTYSTQTGGELTLYKKDPTTATLTFDLNGKSLSQGSAEKPSNVSNLTLSQAYNLSSLNSVGLTATGYTFGGWNTSNTATLSQASITPTQATTYTLYAVWTAQQYTITYKDKGDADFTGVHESGYPTQHTYGTATTLKTASKTGYTFDGWFDNENCTGSAVTSLGATVYTAGMTLYAKWTAKTTSLVLDKNNSDESGTANGSGSVAYDGESATITTPASRTGYHLDGGYYTNGGSPLKVLNENGSFAVDANGDVAGYVDDNKWNNTNSEVTLYAHWAANTFTVVFHKNNDDAKGTMSNQSFTYDVYKELTSNGFTLDNYTFQGWATEENGDVVHENEAEVGNLTATNGGTIDLYAVWVANSHTVTYVANDKTDGTVPTDANSPYNHNAQVTVLGGGTLEKEHYAFVGWTDGVTNYVAGNKFTITDDVTLSARWTCDEKVIVSEGTPTNGSFTLDNSGVLVTCDAAVVVTVSPSANPGYEFDAITVVGVGTKDDNAKTVTYAQNTSGNSEINVTFKAKSLSVTWNLNYEGAPSATVDNYTYGNSVALPTPERTGYTLDGWFTAAEGGDEIDNVGGSNKPTINKEYFAHWSPISCSVVWKVNGEAWTPKTTTGEGQDGSTNANYDAKVSQLPTAPTKADGCGDNFVGWTTSESYSSNNAPTDLFNDAQHAPVIKANPTTYHAVFADYAE